MTLGLWWRLQTWLSTQGERGIIVVLMGAYIIQRVVTIEFNAAGMPGAGEVVSYLWLAIVLYSWVAPAMFQSMLDKEFETVRLNRDF